jgi:hypothetical protein
VESERDFLDRALGRIHTIMLWLIAAGCVVSPVAAGWRGLVGFFLGAAIAYFFFRWVREMTDSLVPGGPPPRKRLVFFLVSRYVIFGVSGYVIVKYFGISMLAALAGLSVSVAAILLEILYELLYAGT